MGPGGAGGPPLAGRVTPRAGASPASLLAARAAMGAMPPGFSAGKGDTGPLRQGPAPTEFHQGMVREPPQMPGLERAPTAMGGLQRPATGSPAMGTSPDVRESLARMLQRPMGPEPGRPMGPALQPRSTEPGRIERPMLGSMAAGARAGLVRRPVMRGMGRGGYR